MSYNGAGVFVRVHDWTSDADAAINIRADRMDEEHDGFATGLTTALTKDGQTTPTANLPMGTYRHTGVGEPTARTQYATVAGLQDGKWNWVDGGGTADAITATYSPALTALVDGQFCFVRATAANTTTTPTFAPNGLTARTIVKAGGQALAVGDIRADGHELILRYDLTNTRWELLNPAIAAARIPTGHIDGLALSAAGSTATFGVTAGIAADSTGTQLMTLGSAFTKTMASWAAGTGNGALDTGSVANSTTYHIFLIQNPTTGAVDILASTSASSPTMPSGYTLKRHIMSMKTNGSAQWPKGYQYGDIFMLDTMPADYNAAPPTSAGNITLSVPTGIKVEAIINGRYRYTVATNVLALWSPSQDDTAGYADGNVLAWIIGTANDNICYNVRKLTDTSGNIRQRGSANAGTHLCVLQGWRHPRGASW